MKRYNFSDGLNEYLHDESRLCGKADFVAFPDSLNDLKKMLSENSNNMQFITIQGARTGITGGCMPQGGLVVNLERMNRILGIRKVNDGEYLVDAEPGVLLTELAAFLFDGITDTSLWNDDSKNELHAFKGGLPYFLPPDPTEKSASIGGMISCNASGARTYHYGSIRDYIHQLTIVLQDGSILELERGVDRAKGNEFTVTTSEGRKVRGIIPSYKLPEVKNAAGYYSKPDMDLIDLFIGSEGTLGVTAKAAIRVIKAPNEVWGITVFFKNQKGALSFVMETREAFREMKTSRRKLILAAIEYFDYRALTLLNIQKQSNPAFANLPILSDSYSDPVYIEFHSDSEESMLDGIDRLIGIIESNGGDENDTWVADNVKELEKMKHFRHAVPEAVNLEIDKRRKEHPSITKLGTDMAVSDDHLLDVMQMYREDIEKSRLQSVMFGHIGNNHIHVNILPKDMKEYEEGKGLYTKWAKKVVDMGGTVSAEHGIGKLKKHLLLLMYGESGINEMKRIKGIFDKMGILNVGNLFESNC